MPRETAALQHVIADILGPVDSIKGYLTVRYGSVAAWARRNGWIDTHVYMTFAGERRGEEVRAELAREFGCDREQIDAALESSATSTAA